MQYLAAQGGETGWRFASIPESSRSLTLFARRSGASSAAGRGSGGGETRRLPEWIGNFQRLLQSVMGTALAKPFLHKQPHELDDALTVSGESHTQLVKSAAYVQAQRDQQSAVQPHCSAVGLRTLMLKLSNNQLVNALDAFNHVYAFFLAGFRFYPPGSVPWMKMHELAGDFLHATESYVLKDEMATPPSFIVVDTRLSSQGSGSSVNFAGGGGRGRAPGRGSSLGHASFGSGSGSGMGMFSGSGMGERDGAFYVPESKKRRVGGARRSSLFYGDYGDYEDYGSPEKGAYRSRSEARDGMARERKLVAKEQRLAARDRRNLQRMLTHLPVDLHFEMYRTFETSAVWGGGQNGEENAGEVTLDLEKTSDETVQEMIRWVAARVGFRRIAKTSKAQGPRADPSSAGHAEGGGDSDGAEGGGGRGIDVPGETAVGGGSDRFQSWLSSEEDNDDGSQSSSSSSDESSDEERGPRFAPSAAVSEQAVIDTNQAQQ